jgi:hypothetical protein
LYTNILQEHAASIFRIKLRTGKLMGYMGLGGRTGQEEWVITAMEGGEMEKSHHQSENKTISLSGLPDRKTGSRERVKTTHISVPRKKILINMKCMSCSLNVLPFFWGVNKRLLTVIPRNTLPLELHSPSKDHLCSFLDPVFLPGGPKVNLY